MQTRKSQLLPPLRPQVGLIDGHEAPLGLRNLLLVPTSNADRWFLTRRCCYVYHCLQLRTRFNYPLIRNEVRMLEATRDIRDHFFIT